MRNVSIVLLCLICLLAASGTLALGDSIVFPHLLEGRGGRVNFDGTAAIPAIPADFFHPGSEPFTGTVNLQGYSGPVDMVAFPGNTGLDARPDAVPVELVQLSLVSANPITVHNSTTGVDSFFDIWVELRSGPRPNQHLALSYNAPGTGGFVVDSFFDIEYRIEFTSPGQTPDGSLVLTNAGSFVLDGTLSQDDGVISPFTWYQNFPGGSPAPGLVLGATETELLPFWLNVGGGSISAEISAVVPEPTTLGLLTMGGLALLIRRRRGILGRSEIMSGITWSPRTWIGLFAVIFALILAAPLAQAQSFNIDLGGGAIPSNSYGGAASQPGYWNFVGSAPKMLTDIGGNLTGVELLFPDAPWPAAFAHPGTSGDDQALLDDFMNWTPAGPMPFVVRGLPIGTYQFYSYSFAPNSANSTVDIVGAPEGFQLLGGGTWPGSHQLGLTYALHTVTLTQPTDVVIDVGVWNGAWGGFNGFQIVQVPEPATLGLLAMGGLMIIRRRRAV